jgi:hypothetical protein
LWYTCLTNFDALLSTPGNAQAATVAEIIQRVRPDVLPINEFDYDEDGLAAQIFQENYLSVPQMGADPIELPLSLRGPFQHRHSLRLRLQQGSYGTLKVIRPTHEEAHEHPRAMMSVAAP